MAIIEHPQRVTNSPTNRHLVAERGGAVAGFASLLLYRGRRAHAASIAIAVDPAHQGHGVGVALMEALIQLGEQWYGIKRFELKVLSANQRAVRLYERFGFEIEATHRQFTQREGQYVDAYSMARLAK